MTYYACSIQVTARRQGCQRDRPLQLEVSSTAPSQSRLGAQGSRSMAPFAGGPRRQNMGALKPGIIEKLMPEAFGASDPGCVRANNEDYYLLAPSMGLYVVADGMGGAQAGEHASKLAAETLWDVVLQNPDSAASTVLVEAFREANHKVMEASMADSALEGMGTTMVAALERKGELWIASVGDSRAYLYDDGEFHAVTEDQ